MKKDKAVKVFKNNILKNSPVSIQLVDLYLILGVSTSVGNATGMAATFALVSVRSDIVILLLRNFIPDRVRIPACIAVIVAFVALVSMILEASVPVLHSSLGTFVPLVIINCIILARTESFVSENGVFLSLLDGISNGLGYGVITVLVIFIKELLGSDRTLGKFVVGGISPISIMSTAPGAFTVPGILSVTHNYFLSKQEREKNNMGGEN